MARPLIGISTYRQDAQWGVWQRPAALLPVGYVDAVAAAGGVPVLLPPVELGGGVGGVGAAETVTAIDGLVLSGGADLDPSGYGAGPHPSTDKPQRLRDAWDLALVRAALEQDLPLLAICRGMQVLNIARGGTLHQHLPEALGHEGHRRQLGRFESRTVRVEPGSRLHEILGDLATVSCSHHQGVDRIGDGLVPVGWDAEDGSVEALQLVDHDFVVAVQWHPEEDGGDLRLFEALIAAATAARGATRESVR